MERRAEMRDAANCVGTRCCVWSEATRNYWQLSYSTNIDRREAPNVADVPDVRSPHHVLILNSLDAYAIHLSSRRVRLIHAAIVLWTSVL